MGYAATDTVGGHELNDEISTEDVSDGASIVGFSVVDAGPVGAVHIPFHNGMTVLYGQNGAGKSYTLGGIQAALSGMAPPTGTAFVHLTLDDDYYREGQDRAPSIDTGADPGLLSNSIGQFLTARLEAALLRESVLSPDVSVDDLMDQIVGAMSASTLLTAVTDVTSGARLADVAASPSAVAAQIGLSRCLSLEPIGRDEPEWAVYISGRHDENSAELSCAMTEAALLGDVQRDWGALTRREKAVVVAIALATESDPVGLERLVGVLRHSKGDDDTSCSADARAYLADALSDDEEPDADLSQILTIDIESEERARRLTEWGWEKLYLTAMEARLGHLLSLMESDLGVSFAFAPERTPAWVPMPLFEVATAKNLPLPHVAGADSDAYITTPTRWLRAHSSIRQAIQRARLDEEFLGEPQEPEEQPFRLAPIAEYTDLVLTDALSGLVHQVSERTNQFLASTLPSAPIIRPSDTTTEAWLDGKWIEWEAYDQKTSKWIVADALSGAQRRWLSLALAFASSSTAPESGFLIIDEPERALHRVAIGQIADRLPELARSRGIPIIVATHAPEFLGARDSALFHIYRSGQQRGKAVAAEMLPIVRSGLATFAENLGMHPADLLQLVKTFVIVEGEHDRIVIERILGDALAQERAIVLPMRGTHQAMSLIDSEILLDFTTARIILVLDHITDSQALNRAWTSASRRARTNPAAARSDFGKAIVQIQGSGSTTHEDQTIVQFAFQVLRSPHASRIDLFGFEESGIEKYLPLQAFTDDSSLTWQGLASEYLRTPRDRREDEKTWLRKHHAITVDNNSIAEAVQIMHRSETSDEFAHLETLVRSSTEAGDDPVPPIA